MSIRSFFSRLFVTRIVREERIVWGRPFDDPAMQKQFDEVFAQMDRTFDCASKLFEMAGKR